MHIGLNAHLLSAQAGYRSAGIHGYIYNTLAHLAAAAPAGWRFTALVGRGNSPTFDSVTLRRAPFTTESPLKRILWEQVIQPWDLRHFDLYHSFAFVSPLVLIRPSVVMVHDLSFIHYPQVITPARRLYLRLFTRISCCRATRVIANSHSTARDIQGTLGIPRERIDVIPPGYDAARFKPLSKVVVDAFRRQKGLPERFWLFLGTLEPRKNLPTLLDAYARLPPDERLPLVLAGGKGWHYDAIFEAVERQGLAGEVHFPGYIPAEDLPLWYNSAETFIFPSIFEGFGMPVLEAMACGPPVIVSDASSLPEVVGEAGRRVPPQDVDAWTRALETAFHDAGWREQAGHRGIVEAKRYSWRKTAELTIRSYQRALGFGEN